jgi:Protein of unknown function (DUF2281)
MSIEQAVVEKLRELSAAKQQEVLNFVEFLAGKAKQRELDALRWAGMTASDAARSVMGTVGDGPSDLSTNPKYFEGFGES